MAVMERFDAPVPVPARAPVPASAPARVSAATRPAAVRTSAHAPSPARGASVPFDGLLAVGAVGGSAAALVVAEVAGLSGTAVTVAVLVGLDLGVLAGAGAGSWLARRAARPERSANRR